MIKSSEIKKAALNKLNFKKTFLVSTVFVLANIALSYAFEYLNNLTVNTPIINVAINIIYLIIFIPLSLGFVSTISKLYKSQHITATTIFNDAILNFAKSIEIFLRIIMKILLPAIIIITSALGILFLTSQNLPITNDNLSGYTLYIGLIYFAVLIGIAISVVPYALSSYILVDNKNMSCKEILKQSAYLMNNNKFDFVKLIISFFGWFIMLAVISAIASMAISEFVGNFITWFGMILLMPYFITSIRVFYEETIDSIVIEDDSQK